MDDKLLIETMAETSYTIAMKEQEAVYPVAGTFTWENELEPCKELWRKVAIGCLETVRLYEQRYKHSVVAAPDATFSVSLSSQNTATIEYEAIELATGKKHKMTYTGNKSE